MNDYLVKALAFNGEVRIYCARTTNLVNEAQRRHDTFPAASASLGRTLSAGAMMGSMLKGDERLSIMVDGGGPIGKIIVNADANGNVTGTVTNPHVHFSRANKLDVRGVVGTEGLLTVTKDLGMKELWTGQVPLVDGELGVDFTYYFAVSEQTPSAVSVGVLVETDNSVIASGGFIVQMMPNASEEVISFFENKLDNFPHISSLLQSGNTPEDIIKLLTDGQLQVLEVLPLQYSCDCSKERFTNGIISLGTEEINSIIEEGNDIETMCHFCGEKYLFTIEDLKSLKGE